MAFHLLHLFDRPAEPDETAAPGEPPAEPADEPPTGSNYQPPEAGRAGERIAAEAEAAAQARERAADEAEQRAAAKDRSEAEADRSAAERERAIAEAPEPPEPPEPAAPPTPVGLGHPRPPGPAPPGMEWTESGGGGWVPLGTVVLKEYAPIRRRTVTI